jgi:hypothetical protein
MENTIGTTETTENTENTEAIEAIEATGITTLFPIFKTRQLEENDNGLDACLRSTTISLEDLVQVMHKLLPKCDLDTTKTAHHFRIDDMCYDIMYRKNIIISVSSESRQDDEAPVLSPLTLPEPVAATVIEPLTLPLPEPLPEPATVIIEPPPENIDVAEKLLDVSEGEWQSVRSKRKKQYSYKSDANEIYFFENEANANFMDFVSVLEGLDQFKTECRKYQLSHGYNISRNVVYDAHDKSRPGHFRCFIPNLAYLSKFDKWLTTKDTHEDTRQFHVFRENSTWPSWTHIADVYGSANVRKLIMNGTSKYGHAYCVETNDLLNFWLENNFRQIESKAPGIYIERFKKFTRWG